MDAIFTAIANKIISKNSNSKMPKTCVEAKKILSDVGLDYKKYDSYLCDRTLYYGLVKEDWTSWPFCKLSCYFDTTQGKKVPRKEKCLVFALTPFVFATAVAI